MSAYLADRQDTRRSLVIGVAVRGEQQRGRLGGDGDEDEPAADEGRGARLLVEQLGCYFFVIKTPIPCAT